MRVAVFDLCESQNTCTTQYAPTRGLPVTSIMAPDSEAELDMDFQACFEDEDPIGATKLQCLSCLFATATGAQNFNDGRLVEPR